MKSKRQRGAQAVEFALMLPFMILIIFAVLDFFLITYNKAVITNASREAARRAVMLSTAAWSPDNVKQVACNYVRNTLISVAEPAITSTCNGATDPAINVTPTSAPGANETVTVTVNYSVRGFSLGTWWNLGTGTNSIGAPFAVSATTSMSHE